MPKISSRTFSTLLVILVCLLSDIKALAQTQNTKTDSIQKISIGLYWNTHSVLNNYPAWEFATQIMWKNRVSVDLGAGYVFASEIFASSKEYIDHKTGFSLIGEIKYYLKKTGKNNGPYVGFGFKHLETNYSANYIAKLYDGDVRYFKYFNNDYYVRLDQFVAKFGYRLTAKDERLFFEFGGNFAARKKHISPIPEKINGTLVTNTDFLSGLNQYPLPFSIDVKVGLVLFPN